MTDSSVADDFLFEEPPTGQWWILGLVMALASLAAIGLLLPFDTMSKIVGAIVLAIFSVVCFVGTVAMYRDRFKTKLYFLNRLEVLEHGQPLSTDRYADFHSVAFGYRADNDQYVSYVTSSKAGINSVRYTGADPHAGPREIRRESFVRMKDAMIEAVAERFAAEAHGPTGVEWYGVTLRPSGIERDGTLHPWIRVNLEINEKNGVLSRSLSGKSLPALTMIGDNVAAGVAAVHILRNQARGNQ